MKKRSNSLWVKSPCSFGFTEKNIFFGKAERFSIQSIYHIQRFCPKDSKDQILQHQKNLIKFRQQIRQCELNRRKPANKWKLLLRRSENQQNKKQKAQNPKKSKNQEVVQRLISKQPIKTDLIYDKYGNRSTFYTSIQQIVFKYAIKKSKSLQNFQDKIIEGRKKFVSGGKRIDLGRPQNFNPGPGSYFINNNTNQNSSFVQKSLRSLSNQSGLNKQNKLNSIIKKRNQGKQNNRKLKKVRFLQIPTQPSSQINF